MKHTIKSFSIIALVAIITIGFAMTGCNNDSTDDPQKVITITGSDSYNGRSAVIMVGTDLISYTIGSSDYVDFSSGSFTFPLIIMGGSSEPWTGSGSYRIAIQLSNPSERQVYTGGQELEALSITNWADRNNAPTYNIQSTTTTINLSQFRVVTD